MSVVPPNWHPSPLPCSFHTVIQPMGQGVSMSLDDIWMHEEMRARGRLLDPTLAAHGCFLAVFAESSLLPFGGESQWLRERETEREREGKGERNSQAGMTLLHNVCCCCMTCLVTLRITTPQSTTKRCVCVVCVKDRERWCWEGGLQACPWVSWGGIVIDCTAVAFNYASIQSMQKAAGARVTFLHSDYSCLLCGSTVLCFHPSAVIYIRCFTQLEHMASVIWGCTMAQVRRTQRMLKHSDLFGKHS